MKSTKVIEILPKKILRNFQGPVQAYKEFGIEQLRIPTIDYGPPSYDDLVKATNYIR